jgi:hypothetical protein
VKPDALGPYVNDQMRVVGELKGEVVMKASMLGPSSMRYTLGQPRADRQPGQRQLIREAVRRTQPPTFRY